MRFTDLGDGWFLVREGSVDAFLQQHPTIRGAPLQACVLRDMLHTITTNNHVERFW